MGHVFPGHDFMVYILPNTFLCVFAPPDAGFDIIVNNKTAGTAFDGYII